MILKAKPGTSQELFPQQKIGNNSCVELKKWKLKKRKRNRVNLKLDKIVQRSKQETFEAFEKLLTR